MRTARNKNGSDTNHSNKSSNVFKIFQMIWIHEGGRIDLQAVVAVTRVHEEAVHRIQHLMRQQEKPLPGNAAYDGNKRRLNQCNSRG